jgi:hypothetical protein
MRCDKCGRLMPGHGPDWALKCGCAGKGPQVPEHPCAKCGDDRHLACVFSTDMPDCDALARWLWTVPMGDMLRAVKSDPLVGASTCSRIAECVGFGEDLRRELALAGCATVGEALKWARDDEHMFLEQGLNQREGNDDDWQLAAYREFEAADKANPVL